MTGADPHFEPTTLPRADGFPGTGLLIRPARYGDTVDSSRWVVVRRLPDLVRRDGGAEVERYAVFLARPVGALSAGALLPTR